MKSKLFAIYDSKAKLYKRPFFMDTLGECIRGFQDLANDEGSEIGKYPEDFTLFELADYDSETGKVIPHSTKISHGLAVDFIKNKVPSMPVSNKVVKMNRAARRAQSKKKGSLRNGMLSQ